ERDGERKASVFMQRQRKRGAGPYHRRGGLRRIGARIVKSSQGVDVGVKFRLHLGDSSMRRQTSEEAISRGLAVAHELIVGVKERLDIYRRPEGWGAYGSPTEIVRRNSHDHYGDAIQKNGTAHDRLIAVEALLPIVFTDQDSRVSNELVRVDGFEI